MIPILYEKTETEFESNGLGRLRECLTCTATEERNGVYECDFTYPVDGHLFDEIICGRIIACEHDDTGNIQPFDIVSYEKPIDGVVSFHAVHISYRQSKLVVSGTGISTLEDALSVLKNSATPTNPFGYVNKMGNKRGYIAAFDGIPKTVRQMLGGTEGSILDSYGGEYEWDLFRVYLWEKRGETKPFTIRYGVNLVEYNDDTDYTETYSAAVPYWTGQDENGNNIIVTGNRVDTQQTTFSGRNDCVPFDLTDKFEEKPTAAQLENMARSLMLSRQTYMPERTIKVDFVRLQDTKEYEYLSELHSCKLCDSIDVSMPKYKMHGTYKIVKTVWNVLLERYDEMELGALSTSLSDALGVSGGSSYSGSSGGGGGLSINDIYPVGSIYMSVDSANPSTLFAGTTWERITGKFLLGATDGGAQGGNSRADIAAGYSGGEPTHTLQASESGLKAHSHNPSTTTEYFVTCATAEANNTRVAYSSSGNRLVDGMTNTSSSVFHHRKATDSPSSAATSAHNNMPPYLAVYVWKRTA